MRIQYDIGGERGGVDGLFARARRILAGDASETPEAPVEAMDMRNGIGRALRLAKGSQHAAKTLVDRKSVV